MREDYTLYFHLLKELLFLVLVFKELAQFFIILPFGTKKNESNYQVVRVY